VLEVRVRHVWLVHLHEIDAHEERLARFGRLVQILDSRLLDIFVEERNADHALVRGVDVLTVDLEVFGHLAARRAGQCALGDLLEHGAQLRIHVGEPGRVSVGVGIQMVEPDIFHFVVALGRGQGVIGFTQMPLAGEEGLVAPCLSTEASVHSAFGSPPP
jgi:hypothetical protein